LVEIVYKAKAGHIGGDLSCLNVLTALYFDIMRVWPDKPKETKRDRFVMSKGHCVEALYVTLEAKGFISREVTDTLGEFGSILSGHPTIEVPGIEVNTGALGHGLSVGVGMAMAAKMDKADYKTYVLMGDGEQGEGSIYEAAMAGNQYKLDNLVAIIDRNRLQISGTTEEVMSLESMRDRWTAFGWDVLEMNGDEMEDIIRTFRSIDYTNKKPHLLISHTTKGKDNHGMVLVDGEHNFKYADGTRYYPMGTTAYAWTHMKETTQEATLKSFGEAGFNKVRMCVFPKNYSLVKDEPALYPFEIRKNDIHSRKSS
jgi:transketolase